MLLLVVLHKADGSTSPSQEKAAWALVPFKVVDGVNLRIEMHHHGLAQQHQLVLDI
jgi:hypothetical protein